MTMARLLLLTITLSLACATGTAQADRASEYKALTDAAVEEHGLGHYEEARALFSRAHAIDPNARTLWGMGIAAFEARQYVDAIELLEAARKDERKPLTSAQRKQTESLLERSRNFVVRVPIRVEPANAQVSIDGRVMEPGQEGVVTLDAGTHQVVVSAPGYEEITRSMRWSAGDADPLELSLAPKPKQKPVEEQVQNAQPASSASTQADVQRSSGALTTLKWVSLGVAVASVGVMAAGLALRQSAANDWNDERECPPDMNESCPDKKRDEAKWKKVAIASGASAGVFAALSTVFFVLDRSPAGQGASVRTRCEPAFTLGASCEVRF
jgi:tetratricopeptide (TPR) repeat protein